MTLTYEDALELKEVGFPQEPESSNTFHRIDDGILTRIPTLSELIEACGEEWYSVRRNNSSKGAFVAHSMQMITAIQTLITTDARQAATGGQYGSTPEQAVKNLWIALNKK